MTGMGELSSEFTSTTGGVMTEEAGAITGELELLTRPTPDGSGIEVLVRYAGARDLYTVTGSPIRAAAKATEDDQFRAVHDLALERLTTPTAAEGGNDAPADLLD